MVKAEGEKQLLQCRPGRVRMAVDTELYGRVLALKYGVHVGLEESKAHYYCITL
jgi:hypothetical protein